MVRIVSSRIKLIFFVLIIFLVIIVLVTVGLVIGVFLFIPLVLMSLFTRMFVKRKQNFNRKEKSRSIEGKVIDAEFKETDNFKN